MKFQAPKLGKQKELDNAEYLLMINEYMDSIITRFQDMAPTDNEWNIKTKRYADGLLWPRGGRQCPSVHRARPT